MVKCVLFFLFPIIIACSGSDGNFDRLLTKFTQTGEISKFERNGEILLPDTLSDELWIIEINAVSVWGIDGDIPDGLMKIRQSSIAVLGENADLAKVFALQFSQIILKPNFPKEKMLKIIQHFDGILISAVENQNIILTTDGVSWYR